MLEIEEQIDLEEGHDDFPDFIRQQISHLPWWMLSILLHIVIICLTMLLIVEKQEKPVQIEISTSLEVEKEKQDPPPRKSVFTKNDKEVINEEISTPDPIVKNVEVSDHQENDADEDFQDVRGNDGVLADTPFTGKFANQAIGMSGSSGSLVGQRRGGRRNLRRHGGNKRTESAVKAGLEWLKRHQSQDGRWDSDGFMQLCGKEQNFPGYCQGKGDSEYDPAMTGLALLCFLGQGNSSSEGEYKQQVKQGIRYLQSIQSQDGCFGSKDTPRHMYNHAIATLAIIEASILSHCNPLLKTSATKAIKFLLSAQTKNGGWRYTWQPGPDDTSVMGWCIMALRLAKDADIKIPDSCFSGATNFIAQVTDQNSYRTGYRQTNGNIEYETAMTNSQHIFSFASKTIDDLQNGAVSEQLRAIFSKHGHSLSTAAQLVSTNYRMINTALGSSTARGNSNGWLISDRNKDYQLQSNGDKFVVSLITEKYANSEAMTAVAMTSQVFMDINRRKQQLAMAAALLAAQQPKWGRDESGYSLVNYYYWYYGTLAMYQMGGDNWGNWNTQMQKALLEKQEQEGCKSGSWPPVGKRCGPGGRIYATTLSILCLEIYYRYTKMRN